MKLIFMLHSLDPVSVLDCQTKEESSAYTGIYKFSINIKESDTLYGLISGSFFNIASNSTHYPPYKPYKLAKL